MHRAAATATPNLAFRQGLTPQTVHPGTGDRDAEGGVTLPAAVAMAARAIGFEPGTSSAPPSRSVQLETDARGFAQARARWSVQACVQWRVTRSGLAAGGAAPRVTRACRI